MPFFNMGEMRGEWDGKDMKNRDDCVKRPYLRFQGLGQELQPKWDLCEIRDVRYVKRAFVGFIGWLIACLMGHLGVASYGGKNWAYGVYPFKMPIFAFLGFRVSLYSLRGYRANLGLQRQFEGYSWFWVVLYCSTYTPIQIQTNNQSVSHIYKVLCKAKRTLNMNNPIYQSK